MPVVVPVLLRVMRSMRTAHIPHNNVLLLQRQLTLMLLLASILDEGHKELTSEALDSELCPMKVSIMMSVYIQFLPAYNSTTQSSDPQKCIAAVE